MIIEKNTIIFKSSPDFFEKERSGAKRNTIRKFKGKELLLFKISKITHIKIECNEKSFIRMLSDISEYQGYYIFSWKNDSEN